MYTFKNRRRNKESRKETKEKRKQLKISDDTKFSHHYMFVATSLWKYLQQKISLPFTI